ncbi:PTR2-domain-containing protein [Ramicandelaber brevisporus]|nr:PTR2-domain-containing protein [Ramicandelaber brevisporus]KAI8867540.1 PTR2-domain-containing protein [Ramicandelaber brevisporus]
MTNTLISQAATMNTHQLPNDLMQNINPIVLIILIPVVDLWIYPLMGKWGIKFRPISRMTAGFMCGAMSMAYSAVIQDRIYSIYQHDHSNSDLINSIGASSSNSSDISSLGSISSFASIADVAGGNHSIQPQSIMYPTPTSPANISICWQIPSYALISISEIFALITGLEYAFNKAPASMKAVVVSLFMLTGCFGAVLNYAFIPLVKDPYITVMYGVIAGITAVLTLLFRYIFRDYDREEAAENVIGCH